MVNFAVYMFVWETASFFFFFPSYKLGQIYIIHKFVLYTKNSFCNLSIRAGWMSPFGHWSREVFSPLELIACTKSGCSVAGVEPQGRPCVCPELRSSSTIKQRVTFSGSAIMHSHFFPHWSFQRSRVALHFHFPSRIRFDVCSQVAASLLVRSTLTTSEVITQVLKADVLSWDLICIIQTFLE